MYRNNTLEGSAHVNKNGDELNGAEHGQTVFAIDPERRRKIMHAEVSEVATRVSRWHIAASAAVLLAAAQCAPGTHHVGGRALAQHLACTVQLHILAALCFQLFWKAS
jgi:hypothetical protein